MMDVSIHVAKPVVSTPPTVQQISSVHVDRNQVSSPVRMAKLPPIASEEQAHPSKMILQSASDELKDSMRYLLSEAQTAEIRIQRGIDSLWQRMLEMLEQRTREMDLELSKSKEECRNLREKCDQLSSQEDSLVRQNAKMSMEIVARERQCHVLESEVQRIRDQLSERESEIERRKEITKVSAATHKADVDSLEKSLNEKNKTIKEYQDKLMIMTEKVQKISKQLSVEKASSEQLQKSTSSQLTQQVSDNRKMALEISKLKSQLASSGQRLTASKEEIKKLELQLEHARSSANSSVSNLQNQHSRIVKTLEEKIAALLLEIESLKNQHQAELGCLKEQLERAVKEGSKEDYLDARIKFLQHQNRQEKIKLSNEKKQ